jgi:L-serine dehydratase
MAPLRAAQAFRWRTPAAARYRVALYGSLGTTGPGHLTDKAIARGLAPVPCEFLWNEESPFRYSNAMRFEALDSAGAVTQTWVAFSIGGGSLEDENGALLSHDDVRYPVTNIAEALAWCNETGKLFWSLPAECEKDLWPWLGEVWQAMDASVRRGLESADEVLPGGLQLRRKAESAYARARNLNGVMRDLSLISAYALAVAEENAAGGIVVTAPTCGSAGVLPAILRYFSADQKVTERQLLRALATAGLFGASVRANGSIAGAEVGCQGEVGAACSMAAAAATQLLGGTPAQIEYAAEMAMEHHLGLTCDPVMGLVQIPCIERNAIGAMRALDCATYALLGDGRHTISFDEVVQVMVETGHNLQSAYRETSKGGLAELWQRRRERLTPGQGGKR